MMIILIQIILSILLLDLLLGVIDLNNKKHIKKIDEELMSVAWHPTRVFFLLSKVFELSNEASGYIFWGVTEKEKPYCWDIKDSLASATIFATMENKRLSHMDIK